MKHYFKKQMNIPSKIYVTFRLKNGKDFIWKIEPEIKMNFMLKSALPLLFGDVEKDMKKNGIYEKKIEINFEIKDTKAETV